MDFVLVTFLICLGFLLTGFLFSLSIGSCLHSGSQFKAGVKALAINFFTSISSVALWLSFAWPMDEYTFISGFLLLAAVFIITECILLLTLKY